MFACVCRRAASPTSWFFFYRRQSSFVVVPPYWHVAPTDLFCFLTLTKTTRVYTKSSHSGTHPSPPIPRIHVLSLHALTNCPFRNPFVFTFINLMGVWGYRISSVPSPLVPECRIRRPNTRQWIASRRSESRIASANPPSPSAPRWYTQSAVPVGCPDSAVQLHSGIRCRYQCPRHRDVSPPS